MPKTRFLTIRIRPEEYAALQYQAGLERRSLTSLVRDACARYLRAFASFEKSLRRDNGKGK
jgi:uncharacterized protein (DUF1778 family)